MEANITLLAILLAKRLRINKCHLEGDSKIITRAILKVGAMHWHIDKIIKEIRKILSKFPQFKVSHILHEGNSKANKLAKDEVILDQGVT